MRRLHKLITLPVKDRWSLFQIFALLPFTRLSLRLFGFKWTFAVIRWLTAVSKQKPPFNEVTEVERLRYWIRFTKLNGPYRGNCLSRSLVLWWLLQRQGIRCEMRIGTRQSMGEFQAHAWLEYQGAPVNAGPRVHQNYLAFKQIFTSTID